MLRCRVARVGRDLGGDTRKMPELAYVNGTFGPIDQARVPIEDRGFQFGDGIYEVVVAYNRRLFLLDRHMQRLRRSAEGIRLLFDFTQRPLEPIMHEGLERSGFSDAMIYIQITRGVAPRNHLIPEGISPTIVMTFKPLPKVPDELRHRGVRLMTTLDVRWTNCFIKSNTLLPNVLARDEAVGCGFDDALFVTEAGKVRECTASNIFVATGGVLRYPALTESILHGVTQAFLVECAAGLGVAAEESAIDLDTLLAADEVFQSGTTTEVLGVTTVNDRKIGDGRVGPLTRRLYDEFLARVRALSA